MADTTNTGGEPMLEMFIFETNELIGQLDEIMLRSDRDKTLGSDDINEVFRITHTIKGSSAMMAFDNISSLSHTVEDLFYFIREKQPPSLDYSLICDLVLEASDFIKQEISKIESGREADGDAAPTADKIKSYLSELSGEPGEDGRKEVKAQKAAVDVGREKHGDGSGDSGQTGLKKYSATVFFEDGCQMENVRAYSIVHNLEGLCGDICFIPENIVDDSSSADYIISNGFSVYFTSAHDIEEIKRVFEQALFVRTYQLNDVGSFDDEIERHFAEERGETEKKTARADSDIRKRQNAPSGVNLKSVKQSLISVNITKLDRLMDLVGEIVITESMVTKSPDLKDLQLDNFGKSARQLRKLTDELQDTVMSMRMVPVAATFQKMNRIVRDMNRKLGKDAELVLRGEDTEVDKSITDHLSDPLMHLVRNSMDHGIESKEERIQKGKDPRGRITLAAKEAGGDVIISVTDDGRGLDREKILKRAREKGLLARPDGGYSDREIFSFILLPGFSTNDCVTEYSGRGVGMDVVEKNIEQVGGSVSIDSEDGGGTSITIKIPLTLAIIDGMMVSVGSSIYTLPITSIKQSFKAGEKDVIRDTGGGEMIMVRGSCYPVVRMYKLFGVETEVKRLEDGMLVMVDGDERTVCVFVDRLIGQQQVVVKPLPRYLMKYSLKGSGIAGCTILGDGTISLILDASGIVNNAV